jgi:copper chaperone CopZ
MPRTQKDETMTNYRVTNLNDKTPEAQQNKLQANLKALEGVEKVSMDVAKSEILLAFSGGREPKKDVIATAVSKAGFTMEGQP